MASAPTPYVRPPRRRSFAGPIVLITLGIVFLLGNMGLLSWHGIGLWFAHFWPLLLILWGGIKLIEYYLAQRAGERAAGLGAGGVVLIILLIASGLVASIVARVGRNVWENVGGNVEMGDEDFASIWGNTYQASDSLEQPFIAGDSLRLNASHGDITINAWDEKKIRVVINKKVVADNQSQADRLMAASKPTLVTQGNEVVLNSGSTSAPEVRIGFFNTTHVRNDLEIYLPRKAAINLASSHGDIKISGREGDVRVNGAHGDIFLEQIAGNASVTMSHGDFAVHKLTGDLSLSGRASDAEIQDVSGTVSLDGDFFNDVSLTNVGKLVRFNSSRTNLQIGSLPGEMKMDPGDLRVENAAGGFNIRTRSKDIRLENIGGDVDIEDKNAEVELHAGRLPMGSVAINNQRGPIQVYLPPQMPFELEASARNGEIQSDFSEVHVQNQGSQAMANGSVGAGGKRVQLTTEHADIEIRRGLVAPEAPAAPAPPADSGKPPKAPKPPKKLTSPGGGGKPIVSTNLI